MQVTDLHGDSRYQIHNNPSGLILLTPMSNSLGYINGHFFYFLKNQTKFFFGNGVYPSVTVILKMVVLVLQAPF